LALELGVKGLLNIQFAICEGELYVLEVNPRASRTVPFTCKATGVPLIRMAVEVMLGKPLSEIPVPNAPEGFVAVKTPVFPFIKFKESDPKLGPEMRSTGEVMGIDTSFPMAFAKALIAAGHTLPETGRVFISVNDLDKQTALEVARLYKGLGFDLVATHGTAAFLQQHQIQAMPIMKKHEGSPNVEEWIAAGRIQLVINTPIGENALTDDSYIRKAAILHNIPMVTTLSGATAMGQAIASLKREIFTVNSLQSILP
jgi:carbamoyl-phosphate synthase large subunit